MLELWVMMIAIFRMFEFFMSYINILANVAHETPGLARKGLFGLFAKSHWKSAT